MPGLRENIENRLLPELTIDEEFARLIPPLAEDEYKGLEESIIAEGCREAIIVWGNIIVDGHNRYRICRAHKIPYRIERKEFTGRNAVQLWMLRNQLARRNLTDLQRIEIVRKCEDAVKAQAEKRMLAGKADPMEKYPKGRTSRDELGAMAGVSGKTYEHATTVLDNAPASVIEATRKSELSINTAYEVTKLPKDKQTEISERIEKGENPRKAVAEVKASHELQSPKATKVLLSIAEDILTKVRKIAAAEKKPVPIMLVRLIEEAISVREDNAVKK